MRPSATRRSGNKSIGTTLAAKCESSRCVSQKLFSKSALNRVRSLQWLVAHSFYAKLLAVKRVTSNKGTELGALAEPSSESSGEEEWTGQKNGQEPVF